jgi:hypothetical protein
MEFEVKYINCDFLHVPSPTAQLITGMFFPISSLHSVFTTFSWVIISMREAVGYGGSLFQTNGSVGYRLSIFPHSLFWLTLDEQQPDFVILFLATWNYTTYTDRSDVFEQRIPQYRAATDCGRTYHILLSSTIFRKDKPFQLSLLLSSATIPATGSCLCRCDVQTRGGF